MLALRLIALALGAFRPFSQVFDLTSGPIRFTGVQHRDQHGVRVEVALVGSPNDAAERLLRVSAPPGAIAAPHFPRDHRRPDRVFRPPIGRVDSSRPYFRRRRQTDALTNYRVNRSRSTRPLLSQTSKKYAVPRVRENDGPCGTDALNS